MSERDNKIMSDAREMHVVLGDIQGRLSSDLTAEILAGLIAKGDEQLGKLKQLDTETATATEDKNQTMSELNDFMKRVRSGAKSAFGDDSLEYERVGGTRRSEIKRGKSKTVAVA